MKIWRTFKRKYRKGNGVWWALVYTWEIHRPEEKGKA